MRLALASLVLALGVVGCGGDKLAGGQGGDGGGTVELRLGANDAWPSGVQSARIRLTRTGGAAGCGAALDTMSVCVCQNAGPGCDFAGSPTPTAAINNLCSGSWTFDTATSNAYSGTACTAGTVLTTTRAMTPDPLDVPFAGSATSNVVFTASSTINTGLDFTGR